MSTSTAATSGAANNLTFGDFTRRVVARDNRGHSFKAILFNIAFAHETNSSSDMFLPTTIHHALRVNNIGLRAIAVIASIIIDIPTIIIRLITLFPRNAQIRKINLSNKMHLPKDFIVATYNMFEPIIIGKKHEDGLVYQSCPSIETNTVSPDVFTQGFNVTFITSEGKMITVRQRSLAQALEGEAPYINQPKLIASEISVNTSLSKRLDTWLFDAIIANDSDKAIAMLHSGAHNFNCSKKSRENTFCATPLALAISKGMTEVATTILKYNEKLRETLPPAEFAKVDAMSGAYQVINVGIRTDIGTSASSTVQYVGKSYAIELENDVLQLVENPHYRWTNGQEPLVSSLSVQ